MFNFELLIPKTFIELCFVFKKLANLHKLKESKLAMKFEHAQISCKPPEAIARCQSNEARALHAQAS